MIAYAIFDKKVGTYGHLISVQDPVILDRELNTMFVKKENNYTLYPADYAVYCLATYDDQTGVLSPVTPPKLHKELMQYGLSHEK